MSVSQKRHSKLNLYRGLFFTLHNVKYKLLNVDKRCATSLNTLNEKFGDIKINE